MESLLEQLAQYRSTGGWLSSFVDQVTRNTRLYLAGDLPRDAWRHLMFSALVVATDDLSVDENLAKIEINGLISRILEQEQKSRS
jgi:hypothetical protein